MTITGINLGKKFGRNWIFKDLSFEIEENESVAIVGPNGSGKSTLLQIISSAQAPSKGEILFTVNDKNVLADDARYQVNFSSPYSELIEEYTLIEHLEFHGKFKSPEKDYSEMIEILGLQSSTHKQVSHFSSGMKQRLKLALQFFFEGSIIAIDEPTSNLDEKGVNWYLDEIQGLMKKRTVIVASNNHIEYSFCKKTIDLTKT